MSIAKYFFHKNLQILNSIVNLKREQQNIAVKKVRDNLHNGLQFHKARCH